MSAGGIPPLQLGDFLLDDVGRLVEGDDHHVTAACVPLDRHLEAVSSIVYAVSDVCGVISFRESSCRSCF